MLLSKLPEKNKKLLLQAFFSYNQVESKILMAVYLLNLDWLQSPLTKYFLIIIH